MIVAEIFLTLTIWGILVSLSIKVTRADQLNRETFPNIILILTDDQDLVLNGMVSYVDIFIAKKKIIMMQKRNNK